MKNAKFRCLGRRGNLTASHTKKYCKDFFITLASGLLVCGLYVNAIIIHLHYVSLMFKYVIVAKVLKIYKILDFSQTVTYAFKRAKLATKSDMSCRILSSVNYIKPIIMFKANKKNLEKCYLVDHYLDSHIYPV